MSHLIPVSLQAHQEPANLQVTNRGPVHCLEAKTFAGRETASNLKQNLYL
jgi:hypothetical protein